jgi:hypothetical protein
LLHSVAINHEEITNASAESQKMNHGHQIEKKNENEIIPKCRPFEKEFYILRPYGMGESFGTAWSTNGVKRSHYKKIIKQVVPIGLIL